MNVSSIKSQYLAPLWNGTKSAFNQYMHFSFGTNSDVFAQELSTSIKGIKQPGSKVFVGGDGFNNLGTNLKTAWGKYQGSIQGKTYLGTIKDSFKGMGPEFSEAAKLSGGLAKTKGFLGVFGKRMPLIGNLIYLATEVPNIWNAFTSPQGSIGTGLAETGKTAIKVGAYAAGAIAGQTLIPIPLVGAIIGGMAAGWIANNLLGKSFTEQQEEIAAKEAERQPQIAQQQGLIPAQEGQIQPQTSVNPFNSNMSTALNNDFNSFAPYDYNDDFMRAQAFPPQMFKQ
jgi:hypothetical protein